jgi:predicted protein tyrosine phosphatase
MNIHILSELYAEGYKPKTDESTVMIRVFEPKDSVSSLIYEEFFKEVICLFFHDIEDKDFINIPEYLKAFSDEQALILVDFFERHKNCDTFVIHCSAGISRSASIAIGLSRFSKEPEIEDNIRSNNRYMPKESIITKISYYLK